MKAKLTLTRHSRKLFFGAVDCKRCTVAVKNGSGEIIGLAYFVDFERRSSKLETAFLVFRFFGDFDCIVHQLVHAFKKNICEHLCINAASAFANFGNKAFVAGCFKVTFLNLKLVAVFSDVEIDLCFRNCVFAIGLGAEISDGSFAGYAVCECSCEFKSIKFHIVPLFREIESLILFVMNGACRLCVNTNQ